MKTNNELFAELLMAGYLYYYVNISIMTDAAYDERAEWVRNNWDSISHPLKKLIDLDSFKSMSSLYYIREACEDESKRYPYGLQRCALLWAEKEALYKFPEVIKKTKKKRKGNKKAAG